MYNHHQTGPAGAVMFAPPFRDPFNYNFDPLIPLQIEMVGAAMHSRFAEENKPGTVMRSGASYSTWYNGGLRTTTYFHNMIGIADGNHRQSHAHRDRRWCRTASCRRATEPFPVPPQTWHFRQSIEYSHDGQSRRSRSRVQVSGRVAVQHLSHGSQLDRARQPGFVDRYAQAHRGAEGGRGEREAR